MQVIENRSERTVASVGWDSHQNRRKQGCAMDHSIMQPQKVQSHRVRLPRAPRMGRWGIAHPPAGRKCSQSSGSYCAEGRRALRAGLARIRLQPTRFWQQQGTPAVWWRKTKKDSLTAKIRPFPQSAVSSGHGITHRPVHERPAEWQ